MSAFTLDTSGRVECAASFQPIGWTIWPDLSPFAQGYVEAIFASLLAVREAGAGKHFINYGFSDLSPETLALILRDCEAWRSCYPAVENEAKAGAAFWELRTKQFVKRPDFPPLTPYLGDDGKVYLREAQ